MKAVHARLCGFTASVRVPFLVSGTQLASPFPLYSTLLGLLGCCAGREVSPKEVRVGFSYFHNGETTDSVERLIRLGVDPKGRLGRIKDRGVGQRSFHVDPMLDLYVVGDNAYEWLSNPVGIPCLGRSQDIAWIQDVSEIELRPAEFGYVRGTWLPFSLNYPPGRIMRFAEYFQNDLLHHVRQAGPSSLFVAIPSDPPGVEIAQENLYHPLDSTAPGEVIYMHRWSIL